MKIRKAPRGLRWGRGGLWGIELLVLLLATTPVAGGDESKSLPGAVGFQAEGPGLFVFDTGFLRGRLKMDGQYQGLYPVVEKATSVELTMPPGLLSPYRVFSRGVRYGDAARDWPTSVKLASDGAVEVHWPARPEHPLDMKAIYRWVEPGTLDFRLQITPEKDMPDFELFLSSYLTKGFRAAVYVQETTQPGKDTSGDSPKGTENRAPQFAHTKQTEKAQPGQEAIPKGSGRFIPVDRPPEAKGGYVMYPRDEKALRLIRDGRWTNPPSPVDWDIGPVLAKPICLRRDDALGITVVLMSPPEDCFAVSSAWNPQAPQSGGYRSLYLSLFGRNIKAGQTAQARCRLLIGRDLKDEQILAIYEKYIKEKE